ncbi:hypothetical protein GGI25_004669 [Coemansia spiralis]|uniref:Dolichol-phosphate mannosyltransferase subunit 3 n=2 Tax=Coemansia TaxID=4863 RepID=A0A9W8G4C6_9FUNG|nr:dolichol-phosphate mannosyltransferase subunit 3 [Coemansia spiralis]KAJ1986850.1 hypothetical protein EDC05_006126 [Coemansia umbellata]KAJ2620547.1 hypothetical protein GGI26_004889 [Coemansia sp. RSA 1358]KAJ2673568.1 hypothetical protein GGI25_004669 [Coemansia spiralis]
MTRAQRIGAFAVIAGSVWVLGMLGWLPLSETVQGEVWPALPLLVLVLLGAYAFINIGYNLLVFRECPEAYYELMQEVQEAKDDLRAKNVDIA